MEIGELKISVRNDKGKGAVRKLRAKGLVPGIFYGPGEESVKIAIDSNTLKTAIGGHEDANPIFNIIPEGEEAKRLEGNRVVLKETQYNILTHEYLHVDLLKIDMAKKLTVEVQIHYTGKPEGVKTGGILQEVRRKLEIDALPSDIPESINVDVSGLNVGDSLHIQDVKLPEGCETDTSVNYTVVTVIAPKVTAEDLGEEIAPEEEAELEGEDLGEGEAESEDEGK